MPAQLLTYRCPFCERPIEVEPGLAEQTVTCSNPDCHKPFHLDVPSVPPAPTLIVPHGLDERPAFVKETAQPVTAPTAPAAAGEPAAAAPFEKDVLTVKPVMFRRYPFRFTCYLVLVVGGLVCVALWLLGDWLAVGLLGLVALAFGGFRLLSWRLRNRTTSLTATNRRLILRAGSFTSHSTEIPYKEIMDVQVHQGMLNRLLKVGDMTLFTRMPDKQQIMVMAIPDPEGAAAEIRKLRLP
jgi:membrane protein YdbS with pleckstrin-like domain